MKLSTLTEIIEDIDNDPLTDGDFSPEGMATKIIDRIDQLPERYVLIGTGDIEENDSGITKFIDLIAEDEDETHPYVRILSYDPDKRHVGLKPLENTVIRVTIEVE